MKKIVLCLTAAVLAAALLCSCSLLSLGESETVTETVGQTEAATEEIYIPSPWGASFSAEGSQQKVAYAFLTSVFPDTWKSQFSCEMKLRTVKWGIGSGSEDDNIKVYISFAVYATEPTQADTDILNEGNYQAGKDDYAGSIVLTRYFYLQKQANGEYQCVDFGLSW